LTDGLFVLIAFFIFQLGSCNGLTILSLRGNNLTYIPDELGRIPRLRVLNLSVNKICNLPFSLTKLKQLQALWLAENQTKPLIKLQSDVEHGTGKRVLTCYLLPQQPINEKDGEDQLVELTCCHVYVFFYFQLICTVIPIVFIPRYGRRRERRESRSNLSLLNCLTTLILR
jgi:Leucine-rich repeat (LRR) protein